MLSLLAAAAAATAPVPTTKCERKANAKAIVWRPHKRANFHARYFHCSLRINWNSRSASFRACCLLVSLFADWTTLKLSRHFFGHFRLQSSSVCVPAKILTSCPAADADIITGACRCFSLLAQQAINGSWLLAVGSFTFGVCTESFVQFCTLCVRKSLAHFNTEQIEFSIQQHTQPSRHRRER